jgi:hypothetical protein
MLTAMAVAMTVTTVAVAAVKTMATTGIAGGTNNNLLKATAEETVAMQRRWQQKHQRCQKWQE